MKKETFDKMVEEQFAICTEVLCDKAGEYADDEDRLHNFKTAAALQGITPRKALVGMMAKHTVSVYDMCKNDLPYTDAKWNEKIGDSINYLLLLKAVVQDERMDALRGRPILWNHDPANIINIDKLDPETRRAVLDDDFYRFHKVRIDTLGPLGPVNPDTGKFV